MHAQYISFFDTPAELFGRVPKKRGGFEGARSGASLTMECLVARWLRAAAGSAAQQ
jgi:hypothetical protein